MVGAMVTAGRKGVGEWKLWVDEGGVDASAAWQLEMETRQKNDRAAKRRLFRLIILANFMPYIYHTLRNRLSCRLNLTKL